MNLLKDDVKSLYLKFLAAAFGSAMSASVFGLVDMAMVGKYQGPVGTAALSVVAPVWNIIYSLGLLTGIGGSILYSVARGTKNKHLDENEFFTAGLLLTVLLSGLFMALMFTSEEPILRLFGADDELLELSKKYLLTVRFVIPSFMFSQILAAFLRNDGVPGLATKAVLIGGVFNIFGDYFFVFTLDMGIFGAGAATCLGSVISVCVMLTHFRSKKNTLRLVPVHGILKKWKDIAVSGFSAFFVDLAMGILTMLFNRQIMKYFGTDALAVYGVIVNISTFVQCCAYGVGQASQPILSQNFGAGKHERIRLLVRYNLITLGILSVIWLALSMIYPNMMIYLFMTATDSVLAIAPFIIRCYATSFPMLLLNIYSTYYFQSVMEPGFAFFVSITRGMVLSGVLIMVLPLICPANSIWFAMTIAETVVAVCVAVRMRKSLRQN